MKSVWKESKIDPECCVQNGSGDFTARSPLYGEQEQDCCFDTRSCVNLTNTRKLGGRLEEAERNPALIMIMYGPVLTSRTEHERKSSHENITMHCNWPGICNEASSHMSRIAWLQKIGIQWSLADLQLANTNYWRFSQRLQNIWILITQFPEHRISIIYYSNSTHNNFDKFSIPQPHFIMIPHKENSTIKD